MSITPVPAGGLSGLETITQQRDALGKVADVRNATNGNEAAQLVNARLTSLGTSLGISAPVQNPSLGLNVDLTL